MHTRPALLLTACLLLTGVLPTRAASDIPDLRGVWNSVEHEGITTGSRHFPKDTPGPHFVSGRFTLDITAQEGRRFTGSKRSDRHEETVMGIIAYDGATVRILEDEGDFTGRLLPDGSLELLYAHTAGTSKGLGIARYVRQAK
jgi:hypothetical protein